MNCRLIHVYKHLPLCFNLPALFNTILMIGKFFIIHTSHTLMDSLKGGSWYCHQSHVLSKPVAWRSRYHTESISARMLAAGFSFLRQQWWGVLAAVSSVLGQREGQILCPPLPPDQISYPISGVSDYIASNPTSPVLMDTVNCSFSMGNTVSYPFSSEFLFCLSWSKLNSVACNQES